MAPTIKLIVTDMDGTLLDGEHRLPPRFETIVYELAARGITWVIASGRQLANLRAQFEVTGTPVDIIAENGALVQVQGEAEPFFRDLSPMADFAAVLEAALKVPGATPVLCGDTCAWVFDGYPEHRATVNRYFKETADWHTLAEVQDVAVCKVAVFHPQAATVLYPALAPFESAALRVILSSPCWVDVQPTRVHKGRGLQALLERRKVLPEEAIVFGDYLNDLEMMQMGTHSVAMANAHPELLRTCRAITRANTEDGVLAYLRSIGILISEETP